MENREVVTIERERIGRIVDERDDYYIVETGKLRKSRHALPKQFAHESDERGGMLVQMSKQMLAASPKLDSDSIDEAAVAAYWGIQRT